MLNTQRTPGRLQAFFQSGEVWTGIFVWLVIAGLCVVVANVVAAAF